VKKKSASRFAPARRNLSTRRSFTQRLVGEGGFFDRRALLILLLCGAACSIITQTLPAFLRLEVAANRPPRMLSFAERVAYQRAIEDVYWRHRVWPNERLDAKPSLDAVMSQA